jgi:hypothetical protein
MQPLFDPARHEPLTATPWHPDLAMAAIARIAAAAEAEFDDREGNWLLHPDDEPPHQGARSSNLYWGAAGVVWALRHLAAAGAVRLARDYTPWIAGYPDRVRDEAATGQHGNASYLFGESGPLPLTWLDTRRDDVADRLHAVVRGNLHNPAHEPLWGNAGTLLAAIRMAEAGAGARWDALVAEGVEALAEDMSIDPDSGAWTWQQDLYGTKSRFLGAGHGLAGNAFAALRGAAHADPARVRTIAQRVEETLSRTALHAAPAGPDDAVALANWHLWSTRRASQPGKPRAACPLCRTATTTTGGSPSSPWARTSARASTGNRRRRRLYPVGWRIPAPCSRAPAISPGRRRVRCPGRSPRSQARG